VDAICFGGVRVLNTDVIDCTLPSSAASGAKSVPLGQSQQGGVMAEKQERGGLPQAQEQNRGSLARRDPFDIPWYSPFAMMRRMQEDMDRLFGGFGAGRGLSARGKEFEAFDWAPAIEAFQRGNEFVVRADIPGLTRDDLSVEIGDDALTIRGERKYDHKEEREGVYHSERAYGSFCRVVPLPDGALGDTAKADFKNGVLEVVIQAPSQEVRRGRRIEIGQKEEPRK
jgi:HSP20 family protein